MTPDQRRELDRLINAYVEAQIALSWIGNADPHSHSEIARVAADTSFDLNDFLHRMQPNPDAVASINAYLARIASRSTSAG